MSDGEDDADEALGEDVEGAGGGEESSRWGWLWIVRWVDVLRFANAHLRFAKTGYSVAVRIEAAKAGEGRRGPG